MSKPVRRARAVNLVPNYVVLLLLLVFSLGPLLIMGFNSLKSRTELADNPLGFPRDLEWGNYSRAWEVGNFSTTTVNSGILVGATVIGVMLLGGMAAYSLAKLDLPGAGALMLFLLVMSSLPIHLFLVPLFVLWRELELLNTYYGLVLIYIALNVPLAIFLLRSYMVQLPQDFEDAARVDGASEWQVFTRVVVPLSWPGFLTVGLVVALAVWNEFLLATVFLQDEDKFTVVTSYQNFATRFSRDWSLTSASAVMMIVPILAIFLTFQRRFIEGLTQGGMKG
jgi:raffinose/stachyose/melibiose transport system permease protein